jgi:hypothetical protein
LESENSRWRFHAQGDDITWLREISTCKIKGQDGYMFAGIISPRIRGAYFALATLAIAEAVRLIVLNLEFTRKRLGVPVYLF